MPTEFLSGTDWQSSSGPVLSRGLHIDDIWPIGAAENKDEAFEGMHPFVACGVQGDRPHNAVGVVLTYDDVSKRVQVNLAPGYIAKQYVCNITTYGGQVATGWAASLHVGSPVYIDDSAEVSLGCTLSCAPANFAAALNPLAGFVWPCQDELPDTYIGGGRTDPFPMSFALANNEAWLTVCVMLWPDAY